VIVRGGQNVTDFRLIFEEKSALRDGRRRDDIEGARDSLITFCNVLVIELVTLCMQSL
jgi:hypothetical protein